MVVTTQKQKPIEIIPLAVISLVNTKKRFGTFEVPIANQDFTPYGQAKTRLVAVSMRNPFSNLWSVYHPIIGNEKTPVQNLAGASRIDYIVAVITVGACMI